MNRSHERKLSADQIEEAKRLRIDHSWSWRSIAIHFCVDVKTMRRHIDPSFIRGAGIASEQSGIGAENRAHRLRMWGDLQFKLRALHVRRKGFSEARHLVLGIDDRAGTDYAKLVIPPVHIVRASAIADC